MSKRKNRSKRQIQDNLKQNEIIEDPEGPDITLEQSNNTSDAAPSTAPDAADDSYDDSEVFDEDVAAQLIRQNFLITELKDQLYKVEDQAQEFQQLLFSERFEHADTKETLAKYEEEVVVLRLALNSAQENHANEVAQIRSEMRAGIDQARAETDQARAEINSARAETNRVIFERDQLRQQFDKVQYSFDRIMDSNAWKLVRKYYDAKYWLRGYRRNENGDFQLKSELKQKSTKRINQRKSLIKVSVTIPTKNAGDDLFILINTLLNQINVVIKEIILVDSGSSDATVAIAKEYGLKVIEIPPESFSHSGARNLGVQAATGEYVLVMTQDALPSSNTFVSRLVNFMANNDLAAASCLEAAKSDVDMFGEWATMNHCRAMGYTMDKDMVFTKPDGNDPLEIRKAANINDVCCMLNRKIAIKMPYHGEYAEDLDLGIRLLESNYKLGLMSTNRVIHSHSRPPSYYLKRTLVDIVNLKKLLKEPVPAGFDFQMISNCVMSCERWLNGIIADFLLKNDEFLSSQDYKARVHALLDKNIQIDGKLNYVDDAVFESELRAFADKGTANNETMIYSVRDTAKSVLNLLSEKYTVVDTEFSRKYIKSVIVAFSLRIGEFTSYYKLTDGNGCNKNCSFLQLGGV
jgi:glycosyltransferase involved in cell wall biosynthesis